MQPLDQIPGINVGWVHAKVADGSYNMIHTRTEHMTADLYTKSFKDFALWGRLKMLANIYSPKQMDANPWVPNPDNRHILIPLLHAGQPVKDWGPSHGHPHTRAAITS